MKVVHLSDRLMADGCMFSWHLELALPDARFSMRIGQPCGGLPFYRLKMGDVRSCAEFCTWAAYMRKDETCLKAESFALTGRVSHVLRMVFFLCLVKLVEVFRPKV